MRRPILTRSIGVLFVALLTTLTMAPAALAEAQTQTDTVKDFTESFADANPCTGDPATITLTYNGVFHGTLDPRGGLHYTVTLTGSFLLEPDDAGLPSYSGHFTDWFGGNSTANTDGFWETFSLHGTGSDGSTLGLNAVTQIHASNGELHVSFDKLSCRS